MCKDFIKAEIHTYIIVTLASLAFCVAMAMRAAQMIRPSARSRQQTLSARITFDNQFTVLH